MIFIDQIKDFEKRLCSLYQHLKIKDKIILLQEEEIKTQQDDFWNDAKSAELIMKKIKKEKKWVSDYNQVKSSLDDLLTLHEFYIDKEVEVEEIGEHVKSTKLLIEHLEFKNMLSNDEDNMPAILIINPGAGGPKIGEKLSIC